MLERDWPVTGDVREASAERFTAHLVCAHQSSRRGTVQSSGFAGCWILWNKVLSDFFRRSEYFVCEMYANSEKQDDAQAKGKHNNLNRP